MNALSLAALLLSQAPPSNVAVEARVVLERNCLRCHGENGVAEKDIFVLDRTRLVDSGQLLPRDLTSPLWKAIASDEMPQDEDMSAADKEVVKRWIEEGAEPWTLEANATRVVIETKAVVATILKDLRGARERDQKYLRYFSIHHLFNAQVPDAELDGYRTALSKLVNSLSWHPSISRPRPIDPQQTILRIDIRDYRWRSETWTKLELNYPYALVETPSVGAVKSLSGASNPYVRADWFVAKASEPPLYHDVLELPKTVGGLEEKLGVDAKRGIEEEKHVVRAGLRRSGVSQHQRVVERHDSNFGAYWKSYDFSSSDVQSSIFIDPLVLQAAGGEMIFSLPNGMQAYFLADSEGGRLDEAPIKIVSDRNYPDDPIIRNGRSCMSCHFEGLKSVKDDVGPMLRELEKAEYDLPKARALYRPQTELTNIIEDDARRFITSLGRAGVRKSHSFRTEPVNALARKFRADLRPELAAAELGVSLAVMQQRIRRSPALQRLGLGQLLAKGGGAKRELWESSFGATLAIFNLETDVDLGDKHGLLERLRGRWAVDVESFAGADDLKTIREDPEPGELLAGLLLLVLHWNFSDTALRLTAPDTVNKKPLTLWTHEALLSSPDRLVLRVRFDNGKQLQVVVRFEGADQIFVRMDGPELPMRRAEPPKNNNVIRRNWRGRW
ncbi:MAG: hypothetical protein RIT81_47585 [Deltaproteobacteria bacterium]